MVRQIGIRAEKGKPGRDDWRNRLVSRFLGLGFGACSNFLGRIDLRVQVARRPRGVGKALTDSDRQLSEGGKRDALVFGAGDFRVCCGHQLLDVFAVQHLRRSHQETARCRHVACGQLARDDIMPELVLVS